MRYIYRVSSDKKTAKMLIFRFLTVKCVGGAEQDWSYLAFYWSALEIKMTTKSNFIFSYNSPEYSTVRHKYKSAVEDFAFSLNRKKKVQTRVWQCSIAISVLHHLFGHNCINLSCRIYPFCLHVKNETADRIDRSPIYCCFIESINPGNRVENETFSVSGPRKLTHYAWHNEKAERYF